MWIHVDPDSTSQSSRTERQARKKEKGGERKTQEAERDHRVKEGRRRIDDKGMGSQAM